MYRYSGTSKVTIQLIAVAETDENHLSLVNSIVLPTTGEVLSTSKVYVDTSVTPAVTTYTIDGAQVDLRTMNVWNSIYKVLEAPSEKES